jgi:ribonuclease Z
MGESRERDSPPVDIYGPEGLRMWLRVAIRYSVSRIVPPYRVHEICHVPVAPEWDMNRRTGRFYYRGTKKDNNRNNNNSNNGRQPPSQQQRWVAKGLTGEDDKSWISIAPTISLEPSSLYGEIEGGRYVTSSLLRFVQHVA